MINQTGDGYADAYSEAEAVSYEAKGWTRVSDKGDDHVALIKQTIEHTFATEGEETAPRKRGRPAKVN